MAKVTGIGGVFFLAKGKGSELAAWYSKHLGIDLADFGGAMFSWAQDPKPDGGHTVWMVADNESEWFKPSASRLMINYRVDDLDGMIQQLKAGGVAIHKGPDDTDHGRFAWIIDPDGNKVELWQPPTAPDGAAK